MTVIPINAAQGWTLGGSEAAAACGLDPYRSRVALWLEKRGELRNDAGEPALWGTLLEPVIFRVLEESGYNVMPAPADGFVDDERPWVVGHPDGFVAIEEVDNLGIESRGATTPLPSTSPRTSARTTAAQLRPDQEEGSQHRADGETKRSADTAAVRGVRSDAGARSPRGLQPTACDSVALPPPPSATASGGILEVKTAGQWAAHEWREESGAPLRYLLQLHHYFYLTGYEVALLAVLIAGQRLETRIVHRDDAVIERMLDLEGEFIDHLRTDTMPAPDGSESARQALLEVFQPSPGLVIRANRSVESHVREARILRESIKARQEQLAKHEQIVQAFMGEATELISRHDTTLAKWTPYDRTALDTKALKEALPGTFTEFSATKTLRRFTLE